MKTALHQCHLDQGARMVDFAGWQMPIHYTSQIAEHHAVRKGAGMFDVSHMLAIDVEGEGACGYLQRMLANDVGRLTLMGKALYSCMLNTDGGVVDDLIVYRLGHCRYRLVVNAGTAEKDVAWLERHLPQAGVELTRRRDLAVIAVQGPDARDKVLQCLEPARAAEAAKLDRFYATEAGEWVVARTGYTGEDGFEVMLPNPEAIPFWQKLVAVGVTPCGLGARDTLRLEAGMHLYGSDMDESCSPLEAGLEWTVAWSPETRDFMGREALQRQRQGECQQFIGLLLEGRGVMRNHLPLLVGERRVGETTSGGFSPTLNRSIALARVAALPEGVLEVEIRGKRQPVSVVRPPFVRNGKASI